MVKILLLLVAGLLVLQGCAVNKTLEATGGSKADGTVQLSFEYGALEKPVIDWVSADATAVKRCQAWGYSKAERFGGVVQQCQYANAYGCNQYFATVSYQCTGGPTPGS